MPTNPKPRPNRGQGSKSKTRSKPKAKPKRPKVRPKARPKLAARGARTSPDRQRAENEALRLRLAEAEQALEAIRAGAVDSLVVEGRGGPRIFSLHGADHSYRVLVEAMSEGAATLAEDGTVLYCNQRLSEMLGVPLERVMGASFERFVPEGSRRTFQAMLREAAGGEGRAELKLSPRGGQALPALLSASVLHDEGRRRFCLVVTDLRAQKRSEELVVAERLARSVLEQAAEAVVVCDGAGRIIRASTTASALCGRNPLHLPFEEAFPLAMSPPPGQRTRRLPGAALRGEVLRAVPASLARPDGSGSELLVSATGLSGSGGANIGCIVTLVDVTRHRRAEAALRASEERLRQALEGAQQGTWEWNLENGDLVCDERGRRLLGLPAKGRATFVQVLAAAHPEDRQALADAMGNAYDGRTPLRVEYRVGDDGSEVRWVQSRSHTFPDGRGGEVGRMSGIVFDVTERKRAQEALEKAHAEAEEGRRTLQALMENVPEGITIADADLTLRMVSRNGEEMVGARHDQLTVEQVSERWRFLYADGVTPMPPEESPLARAILRGEVVRDAEMVQIDERGQALHLSCNAAPIRDGRGQVIGGVVASRDVRERKRMEHELRTANAKLAEADRRKNEFLAQLSHELRNPLSPIRSSLDVLDRTPAGSAPAQRAKQIIDRQVGQLVRLVDDLLDTTRITRNKIQLQRQSLELGELVRRTLEDYRSNFDTAGVALELLGAPSPLPVEGDPNRLAQVVGNLLNNAAKFTPPGGRTTVRLGTDPKREMAIVEVADSGIGMEPQMLARVFEPFAQADSSLDRSKGGLGLGLALVRGLVELHGGEVSAHSDGLDRGSRFVVRLPVARAPRLQATAPAPAAPGVHRRVLLIEDNVDAAESLGELLGMEGHAVAIAHEGRDGLAKVKALRPEVVLCDIGLPGMDGYEVARAIRADPALNEVFLVALSGYAMPEDLQRAAEAGFQRHLAKPPSLEKLCDLLADPR